MARQRQWALVGDGHRTLAERAFAAMHEGIVTGELVAGQRLRIEELAAALDMSHLPIREAIRQLESHGLVEHIPHRGARVTEISLDDLTQLYDARLLVEADIIRRAAASFGDADAEIARAALARHMDAAVQNRRVEAWQAHTEFHFALYRPCGSEWLLRLAKPLWESSQRYRLTIPTVNAEQRLRQAAVEHQEMLDACVEHDGKEAEDILYDHLVRSANLIMKHMGAATTFELRRP